MKKNKQTNIKDKEYRIQIQVDDKWVELPKMTIPQNFNANGFTANPLGGSVLAALNVAQELTNRLYMQNRCKRCGRKMRNPEHIARGYGTTCWHKKQLESKQTLF